MPPYAKNFLEYFRLFFNFIVYFTGLGKNPGFSSKTQPSGFNWFKPGFNGFYGLNWGKIRFPLLIQN